MEILNFYVARLLLVLLSSDVTDGVFNIPTHCCVCDDFSNDPAKRCDVNRICDNSYTTCQEYCETTRKFIDNKWFTSRACGQEKTCADHWFHTVTTLGCIDNSKGEPDNGTTCHKCCKVVNPLQPNFCLDNPDTNFVTFPVSIPTTALTSPTTSTTTPTTAKPTTPTTTQTTIKTTPPKTTLQTTKAIIFTSTTTQKSASNPVTCETCLSENCTRSTVSTCITGDEYCMNTIIQHGNGSSSLSKSCASELECYYDAYIAMKHNTGCGLSSSKTACHYCCKSKLGSTTPCNTDRIPKNVVDFGINNGDTGTQCEVGRDGNYTLTKCSGSTPQCMNTIVLQTNLTVVKKTCESDILCDEDWWKLTRARPGCMKTSLSKSDAGLVCHYCCKSTDGSACNKEMIPDDVKDIINRVDGNWSKWLMWNGCTADCKGVRVRVRSCSEPPPGPNGRGCQGSSYESEDCGPMNCQAAGSGSQAIIG